MIKSQTPTRILLVEDTDDLRTLYSRFLRFHGYEVCEAANGQEALSRLQGQEHDLVLTDVMMPVLDGIELIRHIRSTPSMKGLPVMAVTASGSDLERQAREAGAVDVLAKPVEFPVLLERIALTCGGCRG